MSYANRFIRKDFDEELGVGVYLEIRNPKTQPPDVLRSDQSDTMAATYEIAARLIKGWHAYDATSDADEQPLLELPATPETVAKLPYPMLLWVSAQVQEATAPR